MAQQVLVQMVDDLDGGEAAETVPFSLDGVSYEIDLSDKNAGDLRAELENYIAAARRTGGRRVRRAGSEPAVPPHSRTKEIREWARQNGLDVQNRGRISAEVVGAYDEAQLQANKPEPAKTPRKRATRRKTAK